MSDVRRREITIRGIVQGVGFRPSVHGLASRLALSGSVRNTARGVVIEVEGAPAALAAFEAQLIANPPPLASIDDWVAADIPARGDAGFQVVASDTSTVSAGSTVRITPDAATCDACLAELRDPANRRYRYRRV